MQLNDFNRSFTGNVFGWIEVYQAIVVLNDSVPINLVRLTTGVQREHKLGVLEIVFIPFVSVISLSTGVGLFLSK